MGYITLMIKGLTRMALVCAGLAAAVWIALQLSGQGSGSRQIDHAALPPVAVGPQEEPPVAAAARFLGAWEAGRYSEMYAMLSRTARHGVSEAQFVKLYQDFARDGTVVGVTAAVDRLALGSTAHRNALQAKGKEAPKLPAGKGAAAPAPPPEEIIPIQTTFETTQVGRFSERNALTLVKEGAAWTVNWTPDALLKDFAAKAKLRVNAKDGAARRGRLLDRDGAPLAWSEQVFRIGIVPGRISDEPQMLTTLAEMLGKTPAEVKAVYNKSRANWLIPLGDLPETRRAEVDSRLRNLAGVQVDEVTVRRYREPVLAGPALGLIGQITQWEEQTLAGRGYRDGDWVGRTGVEQWADVSLAGIRGGSLAIIAPDGGYVRQVAQQPQRPGKDVRLTLDSGVQRAAEDAAGAVGLKGALVVLDAATRQVLALVSRPGVDPGAVANNLQNE
ncbi:MAG: hypothetical protein NTZ05_21205, partial [Chloroflexi bacterium]|nr:hypothetical protein [Chloroflexota bacterium]